MSKQGVDCLGRYWRDSCVRGRLTIPICFICVVHSPEDDPVLDNGKISDISVVIEGLRVSRDHYIPILHYKSLCL